MASLALAEGGPPNQICFHAQQTAEKYLKAVIVLHGSTFEKSHQLRYLLERCCGHDPSFEELKDDAIYLTQFYIETVSGRYPVILEKRMPNERILQHQRLGSMFWKKFCGRRGEEISGMPPEMLKRGKVPDTFYHTRKDTWHRFSQKKFGLDTDFRIKKPQSY